MRVAVIGAGPIGIEAATAAQEDGHEVVVYEREAIGGEFRRLGALPLFTPWSACTSPLGRSLLGLDLDDSVPSAASVMHDYLEPLAAKLDVRLGHRVLAIGRERLRRHHSPGSWSRQREDFRLLLSGVDGEFSDRAERVVDCSGRVTLPAGVGGLFAPGELEATRAGRVLHGVVPVDDYAGARVIVVGDGPTGATVAVALSQLQPPAATTWITRGAAVPSFRVTPSSLPAEHRLWQAARDLVEQEQVRHIADAHVARMRVQEDGTVGVLLTDGTDLKAERVIACTGHRPDTRLAQELQVDLSWATEGPRALSGALDAGQPLDAELLTHPEPGYYQLGSKSWGRRRGFFLRHGHAQVSQLIALLGTGH